MEEFNNLSGLPPAPARSVWFWIICALVLIGIGISVFWMFRLPSKPSIPEGLVLGEVIDEKPQFVNLDEKRLSQVSFMTSYRDIDEAVQYYTSYFTNNGWAIQENKAVGEQLHIVTATHAQYALRADVHLQKFLEQSLVFASVLIRVQ